MKQQQKTTVMIATQNNHLLVTAIEDFMRKYPNVNSGDIQTFILGWQSAVSQLNNYPLGTTFLEYLITLRDMAMNGCVGLADAESYQQIIDDILNDKTT